jgi:hypothetical protein
MSDSDITDNVIVGHFFAESVLGIYMSDSVITALVLFGMFLVELVFRLPMFDL